jgi:hypothetical protein
LGTIAACRCVAASSAIEPKGRLLNIHLSLTPLISLLAGILILVMPKLLHYIVAIYLIAIGLIGLLGMHQLRLG